MSFRKLALTAVASMALASTPVLAQATEASSLSVVDSARAGAELSEASNQNDQSDRGFAGFNSAWIVPGIIIIGVIVVLVLIYTGDDDEDSISA